MAVASPHVEATRVGARVAEDGGNAVDAALAAAAALTVCYPHMCAIGGDLFALVRRPGGEILSINGSGAAPQGVDVRSLRVQSASMPLSGPQTVTVPGMVAGWASLCELEGELGFSEVLRPAIELSEQGCSVAPSLARALAEGASELATDQGMREVFFREGVPAGTGMVVRQEALGESLRSIAHEGAGALYGGPVGQRLVAGLRQLGSPMVLGDLIGHETEIGDPLVSRYRAWDVFVNPPNSQGILLLQILRNLESRGVALDPLGRQAGAIASVFRTVAQERERYLADPRWSSVPVAHMLDLDHLRELSEGRGSGFEGGSAYEGRMGHGSSPSGDTVAVVAADSTGRCVSIVQSIFHSFGSGILEPQTGIICHNRGSCFSLDPSSPNVIEGGKRPAHTLMPVLVSRGGEIVAVAGTMGGRAQPQIQAHLLGHMLTRGSDATEAVGAPRWVVGGLDAGSPEDRIFAEARVPTKALEALRTAGMPVELIGAQDEAVGHAQLIDCRSGEFVGASDPRADGSATLVGGPPGTS